MSIESLNAGSQSEIGFHRKDNALSYFFYVCILLFLKRNNLRQWHIVLFFKEGEEFLRLLT